MIFKLSTFLSLVRALFPRWDFFDETGFNYEIQYRVPEHNTWKKMKFAGQQKPYHLFLNPTFNETLAEINVIEHFAREIQESQILQLETSSKTSIKLFLALLKIKVTEYGTIPTSVQFKLLARNKSETIEVYLSPWTFMEQP